MLHTKYQSSMPSSFREEDFQRFQFFFFLLPWQPELWVELNSLNNIGRATPNIPAKFHEDWPCGFGEQDV